MRLLSTVCATALLAPLAAFAADLQLSVANGPPAPAQLYVALFDNAEHYAAGQSLASQAVPLREGSARAVFVDLPPGRYALKVFADRNGNGKLDANMLGVPTEPYGFSNDARGKTGAPDFDAAAVQVDANQTITVHLN